MSSFFQNAFAVAFGIISVIIGSVIAGLVVLGAMYIIYLFYLWIKERIRK